MTHWRIGSVQWLREQQCRQLKQDYARAKQIRTQTLENFEGWDTMTDQQKDAANKQAQRAIGELAGMVMRLIKAELGELKDGD